MVCLLCNYLSGTEILYDEQEIIKGIREFQASAKSFWGACVDSLLPSFSVGKVKQGYIDAKNRGVRIMYITEITKENLKFCMELMRFVELRHLDKVKGNFAVNDIEYVAGSMQGDTLTSLIRSHSVELVNQQRNVFDTLWAHAIPAQERIRKLI
jgi:two-component system, OmpR family, sensor histidine kinase VicK